MITLEASDRSRVVSMPTSNKAIGCGSAIPFVPLRVNRLRMFDRTDCGEKWTDGLRRLNEHARRNEHRGLRGRPPNSQELILAPETITFDNAVKRLSHDCIANQSLLSISSTTG